MKMTKDVRIHLISGESIDVDCSNFTGETLDAFLDSVIYELLDQEYMRIDNLVIPAKSVLYVECLDKNFERNVVLHDYPYDISLKVDGNALARMTTDMLGRSTCLVDWD